MCIADTVHWVVTSAYLCAAHVYDFGQGMVLHACSVFGMLQAAEHAGSQRRVSSLPRATPEEIAEARRAAGASEPSSPTSPAAEAAAAAEKRAEEEDKKAAADAAAAAAAAAAEDQPKSPAKPSDISLTLKGWAAANAVSKGYSRQYGCMAALCAVECAEGSV